MNIGYNRNVSTEATAHVFFYAPNIKMTPQKKLIERFGKIRCCYGDNLSLENHIVAPVRLTAAADPGSGRGGGGLLGRTWVSQSC